MEILLTPPERPRSPPRRQRACLQCTKAKARCHFRSANARACDRCDRLGAGCEAKAKGLRKARQIKPINSRVESLEQRLDALTSALHDKDKAISELAAKTLLPPTPKPDQSLTSRPKASHPPFGLTWAQAQYSLHNYREHLFPHFPFIVVSEDTSAQLLLQTKPSLFRSIMLVVTPLPVPQLAKMKRNVIAYISQHILVENECSIDLLEGLIVLLAWGDLELLYDTQITNLTHMAIGYAHNLGITKIPPAILQQFGMDDVPEDIRHYKRKVITEHMHSLEEQRAFLACYCLVSINSAQFGRQNPLRSQYVEICCQTLSQNTTCPTDFLITQIVRMFHLGDRISESFGAANDDERGRPFLFLLDDHVSALRTELDCAMASLSYDKLSAKFPTFSAERISQIHRSSVLRYHFLLVRLYEPATYIRNTTDEAGNPTSYRTSCLQDCLIAAKNFYDVLFTVPPPDFMYQSLASLGQATFVMIISTRLLLIDNVPGWDIGLARQTLDFPEAMELISTKLDETEKWRKGSAEKFIKEMGVHASQEELAVESRFVGIAKKTRWIGGWFKRRVDSERANSTNMVNFPSVLPPGFEMPGAMQTTAPSWLGGLFDSLGDSEIFHDI